MNREILFKALSRKTNEWVFGYFFYCFDIEYSSQGYDDVPPREYYIKETNGNISAIDINTLSQYIGLRDKNGVKIFEGDLLEDNYIDDGDNEVESSIAVIWDNITACWAIDNSFLQDDSSKTNLVYYLGIENLLIVGNIHDNE